MKDMKTSKVTRGHMRIGIIGAGSMGAILARHLGKLGHQVSIANSRGPPLTGRTTPVSVTLPTMTKFSVRF